MHRSLTAVVVALVVASAPLAAAAQLAPGTTLTGNLDQNLNSKTAQIGQTITISNVASPDHDINGAVIYGHVDAVQRAGQGTSGSIHLAFDKLDTRAGTVYRIRGYATDMKVVTKSNATKEIASTAGGALIGGLLGGGAGYAISKNSRQNVTIPQGSLVTVQITRSRRQSG
jgi:hypothetical protein